MRNAIISLAHARETRGQHAGLLLQRYLSRAATGPNGDPEERRAILRAAIAAAADNDFHALYRDAFERWRGFLPTDATTIDLGTSARVIIGLVRKMSSKPASGFTTFTDTVPSGFSVEGTRRTLLRPGLGYSGQTIQEAD